MGLKLVITDLPTPIPLVRRLITAAVIIVILPVLLTRLRVLTAVILPRMALKAVTMALPTPILPVRHLMAVPAIIAIPDAQRIL